MDRGGPPHRQDRHVEDPGLKGAGVNRSEPWRLAIVGAGSNLGSRVGMLDAARWLLEATPGVRVERMSPIYDTAPVGPPQGRFRNAALRLRTTLTPQALLTHLLAIEAILGRRRRVRWGPRTLDLDLLWMDDAGTHPDADGPALTLPHPGLADRAFALAPLLMVAPELASTYAPALSRVGGPPPRALVPASSRIRRPNEIAVTVHTPDRLDAAAAAVRRLAPETRCAPEPRIRRGPMTTLLRRALAEGAVRVAFLSDWEAVYLGRGQPRRLQAWAPTSASSPAGYRLASHP